MGKTCYLLAFISFLLFACTKQEIIIIPDNDSPSVNNVPAIRIENYVNRVFIDLLGREPLDTESEKEVAALKEKKLTKEARTALITKLQTSSEVPAEGDLSYTEAYHNQVYNLAKARCLDGAGDEVLISFQGFAPSPADFQRLQLVMDSRIHLQEDLITINELFGRMIYNTLYDELNMNTFNFINASFDNLFWRAPTAAEFAAGFKLVEDNSSAAFLGILGQNKGDYVTIISHSRELFEGIIIWAYQQALARRPSTVETVDLLNDFIEHRDIKIIHQQILSSDEYALF